MSQPLGLPYAVLILTLHSMSVLSRALFTESVPFPPEAPDLGSRGQGDEEVLFGLFKCYLTHFIYFTNDLFWSLRQDVSMWPRLALNPFSSAS